MTHKLPDWTWQLEAGDMCINSYHCGNLHCLIGWAYQFEYVDWNLVIKIRGELAKTMRCKTHNVEACQDRHTPDHNARAWNTTMRRLGYDIDKESCL